MKEYKAIYKLKTVNGEKLMDEMVHYITDYGDVITESHYVCTVMGEEHVVEFNPPRIWDRSFLEDYYLEELF